MDRTHPGAPGGAVADRMQKNMVAYFRMFAGPPGVTVVDEDVFWLVSDKTEPGNHVLRARIADADADARIDAILDQIGRRTDHVDWLVFPGCRPVDLGQRLEARGMPGGPGGNWMLAELPAPQRSAPAGFHVVQVRDQAMLAAWAQVSAAGFGDDVQVHAEAYARHGFGADADALHYIGYLDDVPATSGTLLLAGGIAGVWDVSTPPALRGRGLGGALVLAMLREAHARGERLAWTWASQMGRPVYQQIGFVAGDFGVREYQWRRR